MTKRRPSGRGVHTGCGYAKKGPNHRLFDKTPASGTYYAQKCGREWTYFIEVNDTFFGRVLCTADSLVLPGEEPVVAPIDGNDIPESIRRKLDQAALDAAKEWL